MHVFVRARSRAGIRDALVNARRRYSRLKYTRAETCESLGYVVVELPGRIRDSVSLLKTGRRLANCPSITRPAVYLIARENLRDLVVSSRAASANVYCYIERKYKEKNSMFYPCSSNWNIGISVIRKKKKNIDRTTLSEQE